MLLGDDKQTTGILYSMNFFQEPCGDVYNEVSGGEIFSYNHPQEYSGNLSCSWEIQVENGKQLFLSFSTFEVDIHQ